MEVIIIVKAFLRAPGVKYLLAAAGLGVASAALKSYLLKRGYERTVFAIDRLVYLAGGCIAIEALMKALKLAAAVLDLI
jgi:hypothetical protein